MSALSGSHLPVKATIFKSNTRSLYSSVDVFFSGFWNFSQHFCGCRVVGLETFSTLGINPFAIDEKLFRLLEPLFAQYFFFLSNGHVRPSLRDRRRYAEQFGD